MYVYLAAAIVIALASAAGTWRIEEWRHDSQDKARMEAAAEKAKFDRRAIDAAAVGHEKDKRQSAERFKAIDKEVEHVTQSDFYGGNAPVCLDDDGMRQLSAAVGASAAASEPARVVPPVERPRWPWTRRDSALGD